jgi:hypothetical protein
MIKFKLRPYTKNGKFRKPRLTYCKFIVVEDDFPYKEIGKNYEFICGWVVINVYWGEKY